MMKQRRCSSTKRCGDGHTVRCTKSLYHRGACEAPIGYGGRVVWGCLPTLEEVADMRKLVGWF